MSVLDRLHAAGVQVKLERDELVIRPRRPLTDDQLDFLRQHKAEIVRLLRPTRPIVQYRFEDDPTWYTLLGRPGETYEQAEAGLRRQFRQPIAETRPHHFLPAGFPFRRDPDGDGEWKDDDGGTAA